MVKRIITKEMRLLSIAFLFLFAGFDGVQQYVTTFFSEANLPTVGFQSLILVYLFFILSDPLSAVFVSKNGARKSMMIGVVFYVVYIIMLTTEVISLIYAASILLGVGASLLWTGQNSYMVRATKKENRGTNAGFFGTLLYFGSTLGVIILGLLIKRFSFRWSFLYFTFLPGISLWLLTKLKDLRPKKSENHFLLMRKALTSKTAWRISAVWFATFFINGLAIGLIPIQIKNTIGLNYVGYLSSLFYLMPILFAYWFGKLSDARGRKGILVLAFSLSFIGLISLYFSHQVILLVTGIVFIALFFSMAYPMTLALVGDVATKKNLEYLTAFFWMVRNVGVVSSLVLSTFIQTKLIYIVSIATLGISIVILSPLWLKNFSVIKRKISQEMK